MKYRTSRQCRIVASSATTTFLLLALSCSGGEKARRNSREALKSIVISCESYYVDHGMFPEGLSQLTTPIAYLTAWEHSLSYDKSGDTFTVTWHEKTGEARKYSHPERQIVDESFIDIEDDEKTRGLLGGLGNAEMGSFPRRSDSGTVQNGMALVGGLIHHIVDRDGNHVLICGKGRTMQTSDARTGITEICDPKTAKVIWSIARKTGSE